MSMTVSESFGAMYDYTKGAQKRPDKDFINVGVLRAILYAMNLDLDELWGYTSRQAIEHEAARRHNGVPIVTAFEASLRQAFIAGVIWQRNNGMKGPDERHEGAPSTGA